MVSLGKDAERQIDDVMLTAMHAILLRKTATLANQKLLLLKITLQSKHAGPKSSINGFLIMSAYRLVPNSPKPSTPCREFFMNEAWTPKDSPLSALKATVHCSALTQP